MAASLGSSARAATRVQIELASEWRPADVVFEATTDWLGESRTLTLRDDGRAPDAKAGDGVWTGEWDGAEVRALSMRLVARAGEEAPPLELWAGLLSLPSGDERITFSLEEGEGEPRARRSAVALPMPGMEMAASTSVAAMLGWALLVLAWLAWLASRVGRRARA